MTRRQLLPISQIRIFQNPSTIARTSGMTWKQPRRRRQTGQYPTLTSSLMKPGPTQMALPLTKRPQSLRPFKGLPHSPRSADFSTGHSHYSRSLRFVWGTAGKYRLSCCVFTIGVLRRGSSVIITSTTDWGNRGAAIGGVSGIVVVIVLGLVSLRRCSKGKPPATERDLWAENETAQLHGDLMAEMSTESNTVEMDGDDGNMVSRRSVSEAETAYEMATPPAELHGSEVKSGAIPGDVRSRGGDHRDRPNEY